MNEGLKGQERDKYINGMLSEGIDALVRIDSGKELLGAIIDTGNEKLGVDKASIRKAITAAYNKVYNNDKYLKDKDTNETVYEMLEGFNV
tara:strand:+ start:16061 stop:16330 length:270 start_codon:yes stop_codon:yes gene_type:complete